MKWEDKIKDEACREIFREFKKTVVKSGCFEGVVRVLNLLGDKGIPPREVDQWHPRHAEVYDAIGMTVDMLRNASGFDTLQFYNRKIILRKFADFMKWPVHAGLVGPSDKFLEKFRGIDARTLFEPVQYVLAIVDRNAPLNCTANRRKIYWFCKIGDFHAWRNSAAARVEIHKFLGRFGEDFNFDVLWPDSAGQKPEIPDASPVLESLRAAGPFMDDSLWLLALAANPAKEAEEMRSARLREANRKLAMAKEKVDDAIRNLDRYIENVDEYIKNHFKGGNK